MLKHDPLKMAVLPFVCDENNKNDTLKWSSLALDGYFFTPFSPGFSIQHQQSFIFCGFRERKISPVFLLGNQADFLEVHQGTLLKTECFTYNLTHRFLLE